MSSACWSVVFSFVPDTLMPASLFGVGTPTHSEGASTLGGGAPTFGGGAPTFGGAAPTFGGGAPTFGGAAQTVTTTKGAPIS